MELIPNEVDSRHKRKKEDFTRKRKLPLPKLIAFVLSITVSGKSKGVDSKSWEFFKNARRSGLWPDADAVHRCSVSRGRNKVKWEVFEDIFYDGVKLAYEQWPSDTENPKHSKYLWKGMSVFAVDGSKYTLPATEETRKEFEPKSGFEFKSKGHYPQCLVSTVYDVFRRFPVARSITSANGSEREEAMALLPHVAPGNLLLFDRGYPSYELLKYIIENYPGHYLFRCPASQTFPAVEKFLKSKKKEDVIEIEPTDNQKKKLPSAERKKLPSIQVRVIKMVSPDGTESVLLTNLLDKARFSRKCIRKLYFRRWEIETYYRDEKVYLEVETFHSKTCNDIRQELFAAVIMAVIARTLMVLASQDANPQKQEPQFKNAAMTIAAEAFILVPDRPEKAVKIFREILDEIQRVKYYRPRKEREPYKRVTKRAKSKWIRGRARKLEAANA